MYGRFSLAFKITNWCNLNCTHCCENSGPDQPMHFMPLDKIEKYLHEFKDLPYSTSEYVVIGGGEGLGPYLFGDNNYIPDLLMKINKFGGVPTIKTNGVWGNSPELRRSILHSLADVVYKTGTVASLDISVDEFHNNIPAVANIFAEILSNVYVMLAIRPSLMGFFTLASSNALAQLEKELKSRGIVMDELGLKELNVRNIKISEMGVSVFNLRYEQSVHSINVITDYSNLVVDLGRAKENNVFTCRFFAPNFVGENCLQIDGNDTLLLNNYYRAEIKKRPLKTVVNSLIHREK